MLPDDCLLHIFEQCPLQLVIPLRLVNRRWYCLVELLCRGMRSLRLFGSFRGLVDFAKRLKRYNFAVKDFEFQPAILGANELIIRADRLSLDVLSTLTKLFPNVRSLVWYYYSWPR